MLKLQANTSSSANTRKPLSEEAKARIVASRKTYDLNYTLASKVQSHNKQAELKDQITISKDVCTKLGFPQLGLRAGDIDAATAESAGIPAGVYLFPVAKDQAAVFRGAGMSNPKDKSVAPTVLNKCTYEKLAELLEENGMISATRSASYKKDFKVTTVTTEPVVIGNEKGKDVVSFGLFLVSEYTAEELAAFKKEKAAAKLAESGNENPTDEELAAADAEGLDDDGDGDGDEDEEDGELDA